MASKLRGVQVREKPAGSGVWYVFVNWKGQRKAKRIGPKKLAHEIAARIHAKLLLGDTSDLEDAKLVAVPSFEQVAREWLERVPMLRAVRPSSVEKYASAITQHLLPAFGSLALDQITASRVEDWIAAKRLPGGNARTGKGLSDVTLRVVLVVLRMIMKRSVRLGAIAANPMTLVEWRATPPADAVDPFSSYELTRILHATKGIDPELATMLELWARTGARAGEIMGLQAHDIDYHQHTILIRRTWTHRRIGPTKTGIVRTVSYLHPVIEDVPDWRPDPAHAGLLRGLRVRALDSEAFVFLHNGGPWTSNSLNPVWHRVLIKAGVRYRPAEMLRHTFASEMLSRSAPLTYVSKCGGWRSATVLLQVYARWMPDESNTTAATPAQPAKVQTSKNA